MRRIFAVLLVIAFTLGLAGCSELNIPDIKSSPKSTQNDLKTNPSALKEQQIVFYKIDYDKELLVKTTRNIATEQGAMQMALETMLKEKTVTEENIWQKYNVRLQNIKVDQQGLATVDFNQAIKKIKTGSTHEMLLVYSIVNTLTLDPNIKKVQITADGKPLVSIAGHMDLTEPLERDESLIFLPK